MLRLRAAGRMQRTVAACERITTRQLATHASHATSQSVQSAHPHRALHSSSARHDGGGAWAAAAEHDVGSVPSFRSGMGGRGDASRSGRASRSGASSAHSMAARVRESLLREVDPLPMWNRSFLIRHYDQSWNRAPNEQAMDADEEGAQTAGADADDAAAARSPAAGVSPRVHAYLSDMHAALRSNHTDRVFALFAQAQADPLVTALHVELFNVLIMACVKLKQPEASDTQTTATAATAAAAAAVTSMAVFDSIFEHGLEPDFITYITLIDSLLDHSNQAMAFDLLHLLHQQFRCAIADQRRFEGASSAAPVAQADALSEEQAEAARIYANAADLWSPEEYPDNATGTGAHSSSSSRAPFEFSLPSVKSSAAEWWMHTRLLHTHIIFLRKLEHVSRGHTTRSFRVRHIYEPFVIDYMHRSGEVIEAQMHAVAREANAERATKGFGNGGGRQRDDADSSPAHTPASAGFGGLSPHALDWAYRLAIDIRLGLMSYAIARRDLSRAAGHWTDMEAFRRDEGVAHQWGRRANSVHKDTNHLHFYKRALINLVQVQHGLRVLDEPVEPHKRAWARTPGSAPAPADPNVFEGAGHLHTVEDFRTTTMEVYADFWRYLQHLLVAKRAPAAAAAAQTGGDDSVPLSQLGASVLTDVFTLASLSGGGAGMIPESAVDVAARLAREEPPEPLDLAHQRAAEAAAAVQDRINAAKQAPADDGTIDMFSLIESAARQTLRSEKIMREIEGPSAEEQLVAAEVAAGRPFREEEDAVLAEEHIEGPLDADMDVDVMDPLGQVARSVDPDAAVDAVTEDATSASASAAEELDQQFRHGLSEANSAISLNSGAGKQQQQQQQQRQSLHRPLQSVASIRPNSLLPPHTGPVLRDASIAVINTIYERLISTLLLYGAASPARVVTPRSYRQNRELIHALYTDYMSLPLAPASVNTRIMMLAHISSAPAEFHATLLRDGVGGSDGSGGALSPSSILHLFRATFVPRPVGKLRRMWGNYSVRHAAAVPIEHVDNADIELHARTPHAVPDDSMLPRGARALDHSNAVLRAARQPTQLEIQAERVQHFQEVWNAYHVSHGLLYPAGPHSPPGALAAGALAAEATDLAFRRRSYRLVEELARRGVSPQSASDPLLHLLIRSLAFTSYSSRFDPAAAAAADEDAVQSSSRNILTMSFKEKLREVYPLQLLHVKRVLRVLFQMMLSAGVYPDVATLNVLVSACLTHRCYAEAHTVLHHMRHTFHLRPDAHTMNLFMQHNHTKNNPKYAAQVLHDIECALNELVSVEGAVEGSQGGDTTRTVADELKQLRALNDVRRAAGGTVHPMPSSASALQRSLAKREQNLLEPQLQLHVSFNKLLSHYRIAKDAAGMLRVHERMFELGLRPDSYTLALSLEILLLPGNVSSYRTAVELLEHALSPRPMRVEPRGNLQSFVQGVEATRQAAKESIRSARHNAALKREEAHAQEGSALTETSSSSNAAPPLSSTSSSTPSSATSQSAPFDPTSSSSGSSIAISFSYESWFDLHVTSRSWRRVIEAASDLGLWDDTWHLFQRMLRHLSTLPPSDPRSSLFMSEHRWFIVRSVLRALVHHAAHLDPRVRAWYMGRLVRQLAPFASVDFQSDPATVAYDGMTRIPERQQRRAATQLSLDHPHLNHLMMPSEMAALRALDEAARSGNVRAPKGEPDAATEPFVLPTVDEARARRDAATLKATEAMIQLQRKHKLATNPEMGDMSFL